MILTGSKIAQEVERGRITIDPFDHRLINPVSYDFSLGQEIGTYDDYVLDCRRENAFTKRPIPADGLVLMPDRIYLGHTRERMGSEYYVPIIRAKSSIARLGLFIHVTADLIDIGSINEWTLQLHAVQPVRVFSGMLIGQVTFWSTMGEVTLYSGKYQGSVGPLPSGIWSDMQ